MNEFFQAFLTGFIVTALLFLFSTVIVVGLKTVYYAFIRQFFAPPTATTSPKLKRKKTVKKSIPQTPKKFTGIEINPEEIDRIYVKKSS